jgi:hemerythrin
MPLMNWDQSLDIGVDAMNRDHKQLLDVMNRIYDSRDKGGPGINALVKQLGDLCVRHFKTEEAFMQSIAFPDFVAHKRVHERLLAKYGEFAAQIEAAQGRPSEEFFQLLRLWLAAHIKCIDIKYSEHNRKRGARSAA